MFTNGTVITRGTSLGRVFSVVGEQTLTLEIHTGNGTVTGSFGRLRVKKTEKQEETEAGWGLPGSGSRIWQNMEKLARK